MKEMTAILLILIAVIGLIAIIIVKLYYRDKEKDDEKEKLEEFINSTKADYDNEKRKRARSSRNRANFSEAQSYANTIDSQYKEEIKDGRRARKAIASESPVENENNRKHARNREEYYLPEVYIFEIHEDVQVIAQNNHGNNNKRSLPPAEKAYRNFFPAPVQFLVGLYTFIFLMGVPFLPQLKELSKVRAEAKFLQFFNNIRTIRNSVFKEIPLIFGPFITATLSDKEIFPAKEQGFQ